MFTKYCLLAILLFFGGVALDSIINTRCKCTSITNEYDCQIDPTCYWLSMTSKCIDQDSVSDYKYCDKRDNSTCATTLGCAFSNGTCSYFTGCSAYKGSNKAECQAISLRCISDGSQCVNGLQCPEYTSNISCTTYPNPMGKINCVWESNKCKYKDCDKIDKSFSKDSQCKEWNPDCVTTGFGCTSKLDSCSKYSGDAVSCLKYFGTEGYCQQNDDQKSCEARTCLKGKFTTDDDCNSYKSGCITTGISCVNGPTRPNCASYTGTKEECEKMIGADGQCSLENSATNCRVRKCEDAYKSTDIECDEYLNGCISDGQYCVTSYRQCGSITGTQDVCSFISTAGICTQDAGITGACYLKDCVKNSDASFTTDEQCMKIQKTCKTKGSGCVDGLALCSLQDINSCDNAYGSDGRCMVDTASSTCIPKPCSAAPADTANCLSYSTKCVKSPAGCVAFTTCPSIPIDGECTSATGCHRLGICINSSSCFNYGDQFACSQQKQKIQTVLNGVATNSFSKCFWDQETCRLMKCSDISQIATGNSDTRCNTEIEGCIMNGQGCLNKSDLCSSFKGTKKDCESYTPDIKCSNQPDASVDTPCINRTCDTNKVLISDTDCKTYLDGCVTNGAGCISANADCTSYKGTKAACDKFQGVNGLQECSNSEGAASNYNCFTKQCVDAITATDDAGCKALSQRCMWGGKKCVKIASSCIDYYGTKTECNAFNPLCWGIDTAGICRNKLCSDLDKVDPTLEDCQGFLTGCVQQAQGCISINSPCISYTGTTDKCDTFIGNGIKCTNRYYCAPRDCALVDSPTSNEDCLKYHSLCRFNASTNKCMTNSSCSSYPTQGGDISSKLLFCAGLTNNATKAYTNVDNVVSAVPDPKTCGYTEGDTLCSDRKCDQWRIGFTSTCPEYIDGRTTGTQVCALREETVCYEVKPCGTYTITADGTELLQCEKLVEGSGNTRKQCTFDTNTSATNCIAKNNACEGLTSVLQTDDCNTKIGSNICMFWVDKCYTIQNDCTKYTVDTTNGASLCGLLKEFISVQQIQKCTYIDGDTKCSKVVCENIATAASLTECQQYSQNCWYYSNKCYTIQNNCNLYNVDSTSSFSVKLKFCQGMRESTNKQGCSYIDGETTCQVNQTTNYCTLTSIPVTTTGLYQKNIFCNQYRDQNGYMCYALNDADTTCQTDASLHCTKITSAFSQSDCEAKSFSCLYYSSQCIQQTALCNTYDNGAGTSDSKTLTCQKYKQTIDVYTSLTKLSQGDRCSWYNSVDGKCQISPDNCSTFNPDGSANRADFCQKRYNKSTTQCTWRDGDINTQCREKSCYDYDMSNAPNSKLDCPQILNVVCAYYKRTCIKQGDACTGYYVSGVNSEDKSKYCIGLGCAYIIGDKFCRTILANRQYDISALATADRKSACLLADAQLFSTKTICDQTRSCDLYSGGNPGTEQDDCGSMKNADGYPCNKHPTTAGSCTEYQCGTILTAQSQTDCDFFKKGCQFYKSLCYKIDQCWQFNIPSGESTTWCNGLKDKYGNYCKGTIGSSICAARVCSDVAYDNHYDCQQYSNLCKSNRYICVNSSAQCNTFVGSKEYCSKMLDIDNVNGCDASTNQQSPNCSDKQCRDNVTLTSDKECSDYLSGCITRGKNGGCTDGNQPCSYFKGTKEECESFTGVYSGVTRKCSGDSANTENSSCRDRICTDNTVATSAAECSQWGTTCTNTAKGCIDESAPCSSYTGNQDQCNNYFGSNKSKQCWNDELTDTTFHCREITCTDIKGTTNTQCAKILIGDTEKVAQCVTNGKICIPNNQQCSNFYGNEFSCPGFIAKLDGPCKGSEKGYKIGPCTPKICSEAPISYNTDKQCRDYHPSCSTNGNGCQTGAVDCNLVTDSTVCDGKGSCSWVNSCLAIPSKCSEVTTRTVCLQTQITNSFMSKDVIQQCYWEGNRCRNKKCYDYPFKTHEECQKVSKSCTTAGENCITKARCSEYQTVSICNNARSDTAGYCYWDKDSNKCRMRICTDLSATTNEECSNFMATCITTGVGCVDKNKYNCSDFNGSKFNCYKDSEGNPCLYFNQQCLTYVQCESVVSTSHEFCQSISTSCTTNGSRCVAIDKCSNIKKKESCILGTDGECAWIPFQDNNFEDRCLKFTSCSIAYGQTHDYCQSIKSSCISNGKTCVDKVKCAEYKYKMPCNYGGIDGKCAWEETKSACRLQACADNQVGKDTHQGCNLFDKSCTTDGTKCITLAKCQEYTEKSCFLGTDGECTFAYSIGATTGTKTCRLKACQDFQESSTSICDKQLTGCISDGTQCINKKKCVEYTTQVACQSGGVDNSTVQACIFVQDKANATNNACKILSQCSDANTDQVTCNQNQHACQWISTTNGTNTTTTCSGLTCDNLQSSNCANILSFDTTKLTLCSLQNNKCAKVDVCSNTLTKTDCHKVTGYNYQWSGSSCNSCNADICEKNNGTYGTDGTDGTNCTTDPNNTICTDYSNIIKVSLLWLLFQ